MLALFWTQRPMFCDNIDIAFKEAVSKYSYIERGFFFLVSKTYNHHSTKPAKSLNTFYLSLFPQISVALTPRQGNLSQKQRESTV